MEQRGGWRPRSLSVLVPVYNEQATILEVIGRLQGLQFPVPTEIIVVDDGSTDATRRLLLQLNGRPANHPLRVFFHDENRGKGAAVRTAMDQARGDILVIQDADLELDPQDLIGLLQPLLAQEAEVCYGSRFLRPEPAFYRLGTYWANRLLNLLSNLLNGIWISDFNTCYKMFTARVKERLDLSSCGFAMEAEITAKLARMGLDIHERPVGYRPRSPSQGKKIRARDLLSYLWAMLRFRFAPGSGERHPTRVVRLAPAAVSSMPPLPDWPVVTELQEAWNALWQPTDEPARLDAPGPQESPQLLESPTAR